MPPPTTLAGRTVLLVEDEGFIAMDLEDHLSELGAAVIGPVPTLHEAMQLARQETFDAAILDIMLGRDEVFPVADILLERRIPFVFHSAHAEPDRIHRAYPDAVLFPKPGSPDALIAQIARLVGVAA